jgi:hypothetical protein
MEEVEIINKRRFERQSLNVPTALQFHENGAAVVTLTADLGIEGARFCTEKSITPGTPVLLRLQLGPNGQVLECKGKVCWTTDGGDDFTYFGIRFLDLHEDERELLRQFLSQPDQP